MDPSTNSSDMLLKIDIENGYLQKVVFSDESTFHVCGIVNRHNWGYIKDIVYKTVVAGLEDLRRRIVAACATVTPEMLRNTWQELEYRLDICRATRVLTCYGTKIVLQWLKEGKLVINKISQLGPMDPSTNSRCGPPDILGVVCE
ncbi:hypothetical protein ANN_03559 [Periplaneta americana]|uniref:Uncharacterized protein n=1 Tax=Periplaneta americana TaxID=6978 RepID=A0ABQ8U3J9_PERAM|nr:hypothetical protein ANN_03559 [Periplaneta americana]